MTSPYVILFVVNRNISILSKLIRLLLLGRSKDLNEQQTRDFELIKRQYKNIADIMTYDDLVS